MQTPPVRRRHKAASFAVTALAIVLVIFGLPIAAGGVWLITLGGSWYYALAGAGLLATAYGLFRRSMAAVWVYLLTFGGTVIWALWEAGFNIWAQVPRLLAPTIILVLVLATIPALRRLGAPLGQSAAVGVVAVLASLLAQDRPALAQNLTGLQQASALDARRGTETWRFEAVDPEQANSNTVPGRSAPAGPAMAQTDRVHHPVFAFMEPPIGDAVSAYALP